MAAGPIPLPITLAALNSATGSTATLTMEAAAELLLHHHWRMQGLQLSQLLL